MVETLLLLFLHPKLSNQIYQTLLKYSHVIPQASRYLALQLTLRFSQNITTLLAMHAAAGAHVILLDHLKIYNEWALSHKN